MAQELENGSSFNVLSNEDFSASDFHVIEIDTNKVFQKQSERYEGLKIILEGECFVSCDPEQVRQIYPDLVADSRKPVVNLSSLKESLNKLIIPSLKDHDIGQGNPSNETSVHKSKYIRTLTKGDKIGDFEFCLRLEYNLFTVTNSCSTLRLMCIPSSDFPKLSKRNQQFCQNISDTILLKCQTYLKDEKLAILFHNIMTKIKSMEKKKLEIQRPKSAMTDFEATLKLYGQNSSALVPSYIPNSMNMMWKMKLSEQYWKKKIADRKSAQEMENEIKVNYFRSAHHQTARSTKSLEQLKQKESPSCSDDPPEKIAESSLIRAATSAQIPINHPAASNVWIILKAVNKFKHNPNRLSTSKIARSKTHIAKEQKRLSESHISFSDTYGHEREEKKKEVDFDTETSDSNLTSIESRMRKFVHSLPSSSTSDGITSLKRFVVDSRSIPQLGGTVLVRLKQCNPIEEHSHVQHHILPKDALATLQKYRASKQHSNI